MDENYRIELTAGVGKLYPRWYCNEASGIYKYFEGKGCAELR